MSDANADFIAHLPVYVPALLGEIERLKKQTEAMAGALKKLTESAYLRSLDEDLLEMFWESGRRFQMAGEQGGEDIETAGTIIRQVCCYLGDALAAATEARAVLAEAKQPPTPAAPAGR